MRPPEIFEPDVSPREFLETDADDGVEVIMGHSLHEGDEPLHKFHLPHAKKSISSSSEPKKRPSTSQLSV
nr:2307_t:CDS:2 [Entrophospora candida]